MKVVTIAVLAFLLGQVATENRLRSAFDTALQVNCGAKANAER